MVFLNDRAGTGRLRREVFMGWVEIASTIIGLLAVVLFFLFSKVARIIFWETFKNPHRTTKIERYGSELRVKH